LEQLDAPAKRGQKLHVIAEDDPRMRVEGDYGRAQTRRLRCADCRPVASMHAVERPDGDGAVGRLELGR
jgi:hypothetical protein